MMLTAERIIEMLQLRPLPVEGGLFRQTWVSDTVIPPDAMGSRYHGPKPAGTAIYYMLHDAPDSFSALHRLPTDEVYHFYLGDPIEQLLLHADGGWETVVLGHDLVAGQHVQHVAPGGSWQGSRLVPGGAFALLGTTMAPGFDPSDYEGGDRARLMAAYPGAAELIRRLMR